MSMWDKTGDLDDAVALNWIAQILQEPEWEPDTLARIADIVIMTNRDISPREEEEEEEND